MVRPSLFAIGPGRGAWCWIIATLSAFSAACTNNPYPDADARNKVVYLSFREAPKSLDPAVAYDTAAHEITGNVYDTLLEYHYLERPYRLIPALAREVPEAEALDDGGLSYRFELRDDLLFQEDPCFSLNGEGTRTRPITAQDVVFEIERIGDPQVNSPVVEPFANLRGFQAFGERLQKLRKAPQFSTLPAQVQYQRAGGIPGAQAQGARGIVLHLDKAYPQILYWFAMPFTTPVPWEAVAYYDGEEGRPLFADHPVGSGPFLLSRYEKQGRMVLEKNPRWYGVRHPEWKAPGATYPETGEPGDAKRGHLNPAAVGKPLPFVDRIEFRREKEPIPAFNKFLQGYYDASGIIRESFDKVVKEDRLSPEMTALGMRLDKTVTAGIYYIGFNMDDPVVGSAGGVRSRKLRQAMSLASDVQEYTRVFMNGRGLPAESLLPPGIFGHEPDYRNPYRKIDRQRARRLLVEAGYPEGVDPSTQKPLHLTFDVSDTSADGRLRFQFWVNQWRTIGLDVEVEATNYSKFQQKVRDGAYQIFQWGWIADYPDAENFLFLLWSEMARTKNNGPNTANFSNREFDRLFLKVKARKDDAEKLEMIRTMRTILEEERPWIELFHPEDYTLFHGWLDNVKAPGLSVPTAKYQDVRPGIRATKRKAWNHPVLWPAMVLGFLALIVIVPGVRTYYRERR